MQRGCFMWTPTPPLSGQRTPRPGPVRVCMCWLFLAGSGRPASRAPFGAPQLFLGPVLVLSLSARPPTGLGGPACGWGFSCFPFLRPRCLRRSVFSGLECLGPRLLVFPPPFFPSPPPFCFFSCLSFLCFLFVWVFFFSASFFYPDVVCYLCGAGVVCVSWTVGCVGVCCCGRCTLAGARLRLRCVVLCSMVVPVLRVLLPVVWRVSGGAVLAAFLFPVLPLVPCSCALSSGLVLWC